MKNILVLGAMGLSVLLAACEEKKITVNEFMDNPKLLAKWEEKCGGSTGEIGSICDNLDEAKRKLKHKELAEKYKKLSENSDKNKSDK